MKTLKKITLLSFLIGAMLTTALILQGHTPEKNTTNDINFTNAPNISAGDDASICDNKGFKTQGTASLVGTTFWVTEGDGTFSNPFSLKTIYKPGPHDVSDGQVTLKLYVLSKAVGSVTNPMVDEMVLYLNNCVNVKKDVQ